MKRIFLILCLITICNISYADIASVGYVDSVVATKQDTISDIETIRSGAAAGTTAVQPSSLSTVATSGSYNDLSNKPAIPNIPTGPIDGKKYSLIWNGNGFSFEEFTTGGGSTPIDWDAIHAYLNAGSPSGYAGYGFAVNPDNYGYANHCEGSAGYDADMDDELWFGVDEGGSCSDPEFAGMVAGDWYVDIPSPMNVKIEGRALCSGTNGSFAQPGDPDGSGSGDTRYCWCKMTSPAASRWVFDTVFRDAAYCAFRCAYGCGATVRANSDFRSGVFGSVGQ